jgi:putative membrane protein
MSNKELSISILALTLGSALLAAVLFQGFTVVQAVVQQPPTQTMTPKPTPSPKPTVTADHTFMQAAAQGGQAEVTMAKLAGQHAKDDRVKSYASTLDSDHTKANQELQELAGKKSLHLSTAPNATQRATQTRLEKLQGAAFDRAYVTEMVHDHQKDVAEFERVAKTASDPDVKAYAEQTLPTLKAHLTQALELQKEIK